MSTKVPRYLHAQILKDLELKMVLLTGPRQIGKTTLSKGLAKPQDTTYLNWDIAKDRRAILEGSINPRDLLIFDEIHKYKSWRNYLKGVFDDLGDKNRILVTGSARLDLLKKFGDSMQGRYFSHRLHGLTFDEVNGKTRTDIDDFLKLGYFPEPFFSSSATHAQRWSKDYQSRGLIEELTRVEQIQDLGNFELLSHRLTECVGSPLSINALREDLRLNHNTVSKWITALERLYFIFRIQPFGSPKIKAVQKEQKHYHYDWIPISIDSFRFENLIANHLLKWVQYFEDTQGRYLELRYFKLRGGLEIDFVITEKKNPIIAVEVKWSDDQINPLLRQFKYKYPQTALFQVHYTGKKDTIIDGVRVGPAHKLLYEIKSVIENAATPVK